MKHRVGIIAAALALFAAAPSFAQTTLTIATVNNGDMIRMEGLTGVFTAKNPDINVKWVTLEENVLRQRVTIDIATKGGQFDILTIGTPRRRAGLTYLPARARRSIRIPTT